MSLLTPLFLLGLAGIAVPVIIHLIQKERKNVVLFPSLMFLRRIPYQSMDRRRIRNWPLLLLRIAALALIVLAFARPFLRREALAIAAAGGAREAVILVDRSYSLGYEDRWNRAAAEARRAIDALNPADRATLAFFDTGVEVALRATSDKGRLAAALEGAAVGDAGTAFGPALKLAGSILSESGLPNREVILISDFQRHAWRGAQGVRLPDGVALTPVSVAGDAPTANITVTPAALQRTSAGGQDRVTVSAGAINRGGAPAEVTLTLEVDDRVLDSRPLALEAHGSGSVTFTPFAPAAAFTRGTVRLGDDRLDADNVFHFVVSPTRRETLVVVERPDASRAASLYLSRALALSASPAFDVVTRQMVVTPSDLSTAAVIVLNDVPASEPLASQLTTFVERGGGLFVAYGARAAWPSTALTIIPALPQGTVDRTSGTPGRIGSVEYSHPVFEAFRAPRSGDFSAARFYTYRDVRMEGEAQVLARFDDGAPALIERRSGAGRALVWTSSLDVAWNDLALKPVFLPFMHRIGATLASFSQRPASMTVGDVTPAVAAAGRQGGQTEAPVVVLAPSGTRLDDPAVSGVVRLEEQGFYQIRAGERDTAPAVVAANVDLAESDLTGMDPQEVAAGATGLAGGAAPPGTNTPVTNEERERSQRVWWYLLFAGLVLLAGETALSNKPGKN